MKNAPAQEHRSARVTVPIRFAGIKKKLFMSKLFSSFLADYLHLLETHILNISFSYHRCVDQYDMFTSVNVRQ